MGKYDEHEKTDFYTGEIHAYIKCKFPPEYFKEKSVAG